jgi:hypothetical protein
MTVATRSFPTSLVREIKTEVLRYKYMDLDFKLCIQTGGFAPGHAKSECVQAEQLFTILIFLQRKGSGGHCSRCQSRDLGSMSCLEYTQSSPLLHVSWIRRALRSAERVPLTETEDSAVLSMTSMVLGPVDSSGHRFSGFVSTLIATECRTTASFYPRLLFLE